MQPSKAGRVQRAALIVLGAAAGLWLSLAVTLPAVYQELSPDLSIGGWPASLDVRVRQANDLLEGKAAPDRDAGIRALALAANGEPLEASGFRDLGLVVDSSGDHERARQLFAYAHSLSRRDVPTEMWMIEDRVVAGDIPGILTHYDHGLRTSKQLQTVLMPTLVTASAEPLIAQPLGRLLAQRPPWWIQFADYLAAGITNPDTATTLIGQLKLDPDDAREGGDLVAAIGRLVNLGAYQQARTLSLQAVGARGPALPAVANGSFEGREGLPPFGWQYVDDPNLTAAPEPREGAAGSMALSLITEADHSGTVAKQMILLAPGRYRLSALVGEIPVREAQRPMITIACVSAESVPLHTFPLPATTGGRRVEQSFAIAPGCPAQWLSIVARSGSETPAQAPWIDDIRIRAE